MIHTHTRKQFLDLHVGLGLDFVFMCLFRFTLLSVSNISLDLLIPALFAFVVLDLVSSVRSQDIGWEERHRNDLFCVEWDLEP